MEDVTHYNYFDYIGEDGETLQFKPDSDINFILFTQKMKEEWLNGSGNYFTKCFGL